MRSSEAPGNFEVGAQRQLEVGHGEAHGGSGSRETKCVSVVSSVVGRLAALVEGVSSALDVTYKLAHCNHTTVSHNMRGERERLDVTFTLGAGANEEDRSQANATVGRLRVEAGDEAMFLRLHHSLARVTWSLRNSHALHRTSVGTRVT